MLPLASTMVRQLFWAALGCAVAWGIIDGIMYVLTCVFERGKDRRLYRAITGSANEEDGIALLADELDDELEPLTTENERRSIYAGLYKRLGTTKPPVVGFERSDFGGAIGMFLVAFGAAMPVTLPLLLLQNYPFAAVRVSNVIALVMLFGMGYRWAQYSGGKPLRFGLLLAGVGVAMVLVAIPLGG
ncbi:MAG: hypothetical protein IPK16_16425 [Anaerolineales bacterium]|nr:hypothetical protein [Anaerolineales bacterium]